MWQVHTYYTSTVFKLKGIPGQYFQSKLPPFPCSTSTSLFQRSHHETWILLWILHKLNKKTHPKKRMMSASFGDERSGPEKNTLWSRVVQGGVWLDFGSFRGRIPNIFYRFGWCHLSSRFTIHPKTQTGWKWDSLFFAVPVVCLCSSLKFKHTFHSGQME